MFNVTLMGASFETGNMGVSALAASLVKLIKDIRPEANISFFLAGPSAKTTRIDIDNKIVDIKIINFRLSPKASIGEHILWLFLLACIYRMIPFRSIKEKIIQSNWRLKTLASSNIIGSIHGGDSFSDIYGLERLILGSIPDIIAFLLGKKLVLLPQTYGPYTSKIARYIAKFIIKRASIVVSRDREGIETVNNILDKRSVGKPILLCPDVAFVLNISKENTPNICPQLNKSDNIPIIGFNISGLLYSGGYSRHNMFGLKYDYKEFVHSLTERFLRETSAHVLLIPHTIAPSGHVEDDLGACQEVLKRFSDSYHNRIHVALEKRNPSLIKGIISLCDFFIGSRMHACIAALSQGIPVVGVAYSRKFKGVFDSVGVGEMVIDARSVDMRTSIDFICNQFQRLKESEVILKDNAQVTKNLIYERFRYILDLDHAR